jgi:hypothetical protein
MFSRKEAQATVVKSFSVLAAGAAVGVAEAKSLERAGIFTNLLHAV